MTPPERIRVLVVDDELPARQRLVDLLRKDSRIGSILEAADGAAAVATIQNQRPDLVFLDVQMPELDGLGVLDAVGPGRMPPTIFVTAYDRHAIRAFEADALDYLLKPFSDERYEAAMARFRFSEWCFDRLVVKSAGKTRFVRLADIDWIEAAGVYVSLHVAGKEHLYRAALTDLAARLDPIRFVRVHRSAVVNIDSIVELEPISHGEFAVVLKDGSRSRVSRSYRAQLEKRLGQSL
jgi:two-component system, LytTR family, response regulator